MMLRDPSEEGRTATNLELFFDLVFVVTVSAIAGQWHHAIAGGDVASGLVSLAVVLFAVWWAWMGFTWFANFFDTDDVAYRLLVFVQLLASLGLASGIPYVFQDDDFRVMTCCYVVLRVAMSLQWLRAGRANPQLRRYSLRWASGIWACHVFWVVFAFGHWPGAVMVLVGCAGELAVPVWANRLPPGRRAVTHPEHIEERYGLFTLITLGEMVLGASEAFNGALEDHAHSWPLVTAALLAFLLWWLYFGFLGHYDLGDNRTAFIWGFGARCTARRTARGADHRRGFRFSHRLGRRRAPHPGPHNPAPVPAPSKGVAPGRGDGVAQGAVACCGYLV